MRSNLRFTVFGDLLHSIKLNRFKRKWLKNNKHNETTPMNVFPLEVVSVGNYSYGELNVITFNNKSKLKIGNYVSIAQDVKFLLDVEHYLDTPTLYPFSAKIFTKGVDESISKGDIVLEDGCWIGYGVTILSGVKVGRHSVIAAGSVVTKDVPAGELWMGSPAKFYKKVDF